MLAMGDIGKEDEELAKALARKAVTYLAETYPPSKPLETSDIGSAVEKVLVSGGHYEIVRAFILSREESRRKYLQREALGVEDDIGNLTDNALSVLKKLYLWKDKDGKTVETPKGMLRRVARSVAQAERTPKKRKRWEKEFFELMMRWEFLPGTRVLANAGKEKQQMGNCFVFDVEDSVDGIFKTLYESSITVRYGGGCGCNFSKIRPKGDIVAGEPGIASGPVKIMWMFDLPNSIFIQQGDYQPANMAILNVDHPDILEFIAAKEKDDGTLSRTNLSVGISDDFMEKVKKDAGWELINPRNGKVVNKIKAQAIFELIATYAHRTGDPGIVFLDRINQDNPTLKGLGPITATNPCGEEPLYPYESCNLGYLNLTAFVEAKDGEKLVFSFPRLERASRIATRFMDNTIDVSWFPLVKQKETIQNFRRIGIGVTGWADVLVDLGIPYNDKRALELARRVGKTIADACHEESFRLGEEKGPFPYVKYSIWAKKKRKPRNVMTNAIPPSSSNAPIFGTSYSIEPYFALAFYLRFGETRIKNVNERLLDRLKLTVGGADRDSFFEKIFANQGSIQSIEGIPPKVKRLFLTAHDLSWRDHIRMQAAWQEHVDNAITKTVNLPHSATVDDVEKVYLMAWELGCKGMTVYRDQSKKDQIVEFGKPSKCDVNQGEGGGACPTCG